MSHLNQYWASDGQHKKNDDRESLLPQSTQIGARVNRYNPMPPLDDPVTFRTRNADEYENNRRHRWHCFWQVMLFLLLAGVLAVAIFAYWYPKANELGGAPMVGNGTGPCIFDPDDMDTSVCANADDTVTFAHNGTELGRMYPNGAAQRGLDVLATGPNSFAGGRESIATAEGAFAFGYSGGPPPFFTNPPTAAPFNCSAFNSTLLPVIGLQNLRATADGAWVLAWAQGGVVEASGLGASAQGMATGPNNDAFILSTGGGSHAEGCASDAVVAATEKGAHSEGYATDTGSLLWASGLGAHAEGYVSNGECTVASGDGAHAEGYATKAEGGASHAEGWKSRAVGLYSHAEGYGSGGGAPPPECVFYYEDPDDPLRNISLPTGMGVDGVASGAASHSEGWTTRAFSEASHSEGRQTVSQGIHSHAEGTCSWAVGSHSHSEGGYIEDPDPFGNPLCDGFIPLSHSGPYSIGIASHAEGVCGEAVGDASHSEGRQTFAMGKGAHSEGTATEAYGDDSHAEGYFALAEGFASHTEGFRTTASAEASHAEGWECYVSPDALAGHCEGLQSFSSAPQSRGVYAEGGHSEGVNTAVQENARGGHAGGIGGIAHLPAMWAHGFKSNQQDAAEPQLVRYNQPTSTRSTTGPVIPSVTFDLPVMHTRASVWGGKLTILAYGSDNVAPRVYHHQYLVTSVVVGGAHTLIDVQPLMTPVVYGSWLLPPSSTVLAGNTDITVTGVAEAAPPLTGVETQWSVGWEVWEGWNDPTGLLGVRRGQPKEQDLNPPRRRRRATDFVPRSKTA